MWKLLGDKFAPKTLASDQLSPGADCPKTPTAGLKAPKNAISPAYMAFTRLYEYELEYIRIYWHNKGRTIKTHLTGAALPMGERAQGEVAAP